MELDIAKLDGCNIIWLAAPKEVIGENNKVTQLICSKMKLGDADASGRRSPVDTGETFSLEVDIFFYFGYCILLVSFIQPTDISTVLLWL